jgi:hypothetical protein
LVLGCSIELNCRTLHLQQAKVGKFVAVILSPDLSPSLRMVISLNHIGDRLSSKHAAGANAIWLKDGLAAMMENDR